MKVFFVYIDRTADGRPFYVGKGLHKRTGLRGRRNNHWKNVAAKHEWHREVVLATKDEQYPLDEEKRLIREHKTFYGHADYVWGVNKTEGGDGSLGFKHTPETIEKLRQLSTGRRHNTETKERCRAVMLGKIHSEHALKLMSEANSGERHYMFGKKMSIENRQKRAGENSGRAKLTWSNVHDIRRRHSEGTSYTELAAEYGIKYQAIYKIVTHRAWKVTEGHVAS